MENKLIHNIPASYAERDELRNRIQAFVDDLTIQPPLSLDDLSNFADQLIREYALDVEVRGWLMVEIHNQVWKETVASIPYERRVLLLPKCLSNSAKCQAEIDELGLLCHRCSHCSIPDLQDKAESLGIMSIVAEGFTSVVGLIQNRVVDSVIGVSCLDSLEKAFPLLISNAVPGLAIPLNTSGCKDTHVDYEYVIRMMGMRSDNEARLLDYDGLRADLKRWFSKENLAGHFSPAKDQTSSVALEWMGGEGKRWRPYLLAATYLALTGGAEVPDDVQRAAIAVECFHKASLVHDDIQDNDKERYGKPTINALYGVPIAINVGDILLGEGYRLLSLCDARALTAVAADAHIALCKGQGMELEWSVSPRPLTLDWVLEMQQAHLLTDITQFAGGIPYSKQICFMSEHSQKYPQLQKDSSLLKKIKTIETAINQRTYYYIPKDKINEACNKIKNGDIILITTHIKGLDTSHLGFAWKKEGKTYLLHASSKGKQVMISSLPLQEYMEGIDSQSGIMLARAAKTLAE